MRGQFHVPTYECHQLAHSALDMQDIGALDSDNTTLDAQRGQQNVGAVVFDDLANFVKALEQNGIKLGISHHDGLHKDFGRHDEIMQALLGTKDAL
jgi:hypothetical protein